MSEVLPEGVPVAQPDGVFGGYVRHAAHPAGWYRTMDRGFAVEHFGFPALPRRGERHTARDGSVWEFALTGSDWWELAEYRPTGGYENVTSWTAQRRHFVEPGAQHLLCGSGTVVRPGEQFAAAHRSVLTQARIDAMWLCAACEREAAKRRRPAAVELVEYAQRLRMFGERMPGGEGTWREWDDRAERFLRDLAAASETQEKAGPTG